MSTTVTQEYLSLLRPWAEAMRPYLFTPADRPDLMYFGDGTNGWGVQTNQKAFSAYAVLAALPGGEAKWLDTALAMLRYSLETHIVGSYHLTNAEDARWGHTWISVLGVERMMHGVEAIWEQLTEADRALLREMLISEADWLLSEYPLVAGLTKGNKPESNMWNGALMLRVASMYPDCPHAQEYIERGTDFIVNAISMPSSETDNRVYNGKSVSERFVGANFFESMGCNHHGYMNVGYMVITLSGAAMLHFHYRHRGLTPPPVLYHNWDKLWKLVRSCIADDGRLIRIGGDTRVRYCYCQDYLLHCLNMAADCLGEDTEAWERGWIEILKKEMAENGDGTFLSSRTELFVEKSPLYYTRLESDRATSIAFSAWQRYKLRDFETQNGMPGYDWDPDCKIPYDQWSDEYHGSFYVRSDKRLAAFTWISGERPMALCVPPSDSSMLEWKNNLTGLIYGDGVKDVNRLGEYGGKMIPGGFVSWGSYINHTDGLLEEQLREEDTLENQIAFAALPDGVTVVTLQRARATKTCHVTRVHGLNLNIPNDLFNGFKRIYKEHDNAVEIDGKMTVRAIYGGKPEILRPAYRQIGLKQTLYRERGFLHTDEICLPALDGPQWYTAGQTVYDIGVAIACAGGFAAARGEQIPLEGELRGIRVIGADGVEYILVANFGAEDATVELGGKTVTLPASAAELL